MGLVCMEKNQEMNNLQNSKLDQYVNDLIKLHECFENGQEDSQEADNLRDNLYDLEKDLTKEENELIESLSGDLHQTNHESMYYQISTEERKKLIEELFQKIPALDTSILKILRAGLNLGEPCVALLRALVWKEKLPQVSHKFLDFVIKNKEKLS